MASRLTQRRTVQLDQRRYMRQLTVVDDDDVVAAAGSGIGGRQRQAARADIPAASAACFTSLPLSIRSIIRTRPLGVRRAFWWMFIRGAPLKVGWIRNPSFSVPLRMNNLHSFDTYIQRQPSHCVPVLRAGLEPSDDRGRLPESRRRRDQGELGRAARVQPCA